jgi:acyl carrier protein phosphodiesterase
MRPMNFFGHACVAIVRSESPRFVLGTMLPDLASMASLRLGGLRDPELAAGVALHHHTDRLFHGAEAFRGLCESALRDLEGAGVARGAARAVGHVGSELLLDGVLSVDEHARATYARALELALRDRVEQEVGFEGDTSPVRLRRLLERLSEGPLPEGYRDVDFVYARLEGLLATRPRLALCPGDAVPVRSWLKKAARRLESDGAALLRHVRESVLRA